MLGQVFQPILEQMSNISSRDSGVLNNTGFVVASVHTPIDEDTAYDAVTSNPVLNKSFSIGDYTFVAFGTRSMFDYIVYTKGTDRDAHYFCSMLAVSLSNIQLHCGNKYDKTNYIKNVLLGNVLPGDVDLRSDELQIDADIPRIVYIVQTDGTNDLPVQHLLQNMFPDQNFVLAMDNENIVIIKALTEPYTKEHLKKTAQSIVEMINSELMTTVYVGMGTPTDVINDISRSYSEALLALEIGRVFDSDKYILSYDTLGIGRLIYQLPSKLCELFLDEIFKKESINVLDDETLQTIHKFFENNLNVSETSRQLFVHRNTLVYRLDKIERLTGLDLRKFDDAVVFKVAVLVNKYLNSNPSKF